MDEILMYLRSRSRILLPEWSSICWVQSRTALQRSVYRGDIMFVQRWIRRAYVPADDVNARLSVDDSRRVCGDESLAGNTALSLAMLRNDKDMVQLLREHGGDSDLAEACMVEYYKKKWTSRLQWESYLGNVKNVIRCIQKGADVNAPVTAGSSMLASFNYPSYIGKPPLSIAMTKKHNKVVEVLQKHGAITWDPQVISELDSLPLALAARSEYRSWITSAESISAAAAVAVRNYFHARPLLDRPMLDDHEQRIVEFIIDVHGKLLPDVETADELAQDHDTEITFSDIEASLNGTNKGFKKLVQAHKERVVYLRDGVSNRNVLHLVAKHGSLDKLITILEELDDRQLISLLNTQDKDGQTPLMLAVLARKNDMVASLCKREPRIAGEILPNIEDNQHKTALDYAKEMNESSMEMELKKREDVQFYQDEHYREMELWAENVNKIGTASGVIAALMFASNQSNVAIPMNSKVEIWSTVCFCFALGGVFAGIMNIVAAPRPKKHNVKATIFYMRHMFAISSIMVSISSASFLGALVAVASADRVHTTTPATAMIKAAPMSLYIILIGLTILACSLSRIAAIRKFGKRIF